MADSLAVKEGEAASPAIQPDYREIGRSLGEQLRTKERKIGIIADWKMSEAVQSEISGLKEALEGRDVYKRQVRLQRQKKTADMRRSKQI